MQYIENLPVGTIVIDDQPDGWFELTVTRNGQETCTYLANARSREELDAWVAVANSHAKDLERILKRPPAEIVEDIKLITIPEIHARVKEGKEYARILTEVRAGSVGNGPVTPGVLKFFELMAQEKLQHG